MKLLRRTAIQINFMIKLVPQTFVPLEELPDERGGKFYRSGMMDEKLVCFPLDIKPDFFSFVSRPSYSGQMQTQATRDEMPDRSASSLFEAIWKPLFTPGWFTSWHAPAMNIPNTSSEDMSRISFNWAWFKYHITPWQTSAP